MRWILLGLPTIVFLVLVLVLSQPEATPEEETSVKVSSETPPGSLPSAPKAVKSNPDRPKKARQNPQKPKKESSPEFDPIAFLENCLEHYRQNFRGYRLTFHKQEALGGKLQKPETIQVHFREKPHSVFFTWLQGARKAERAVYVEGENGGKMLARPYGAIARAIAGDIVERDPEGAEARQSGRYPITDFGLKKGMERTLNGWKKARERGALHVEYLGVHKVKELDDRECYKLHRFKYDQPEYDGVIDLIVYIDKETLLQVASVLKGEGGKLIGRYFFRDIHLNPEFKEDQFKPSALKP